MWLGTILVSIIGYFIGSFVFGKWIVKLTTGKNISEIGSCNIGAANAARAGGKLIGLIVFLLDFVKIFVVAFIALGFASIKDNKNLFVSTSIMIPVMFSLIGHIFPIFNKFKGGKGVSSFAAAILIYNWVLGLVFIGIWLMLTFTINKICVSSIVSIILVVILVWIPIMHNIYDLDNKTIWDWNSTVLYKFLYETNKLNNKVNFNWMFMFKIKATELKTEFNVFDSFIFTNILITIGGIVIVIKHYSNIFRLIKRQEPSFIDWKKVKK